MVRIMYHKVIKPVSSWGTDMTRLLYKSLHKSVSSKQAGFGLIELMVGMLISLLVAVAAYSVFKASAMTARRVIDTEATWHDAELALMSLTQNIANAGYMMNLTAAGAINPVQVAPSGWTVPGLSTRSEKLTLTSNGTTGNPLTVIPVNSVWDIASNPATGYPSLQWTQWTNGTAAPAVYYADGVLAMRFQFSCVSTPSAYQPACPGGITDMRSVQVALLVRGLQPDPSGQPVSAASYTFPDGSVYTVPTSCSGQVDCLTYRHQLFVTEVPLRNVNWANNL